MCVLIELNHESAWNVDLEFFVQHVTDRIAQYCKILWFRKKHTAMSGNKQHLIMNKVLVKILVVAVCWVQNCSILPIPCYCIKSPSWVLNWNFLRWPWLQIAHCSLSSSWWQLFPQQLFCCHNWRTCMWEIRRWNRPPRNHFSLWGTEL